MGEFLEEDFPLGDETKRIFLSTKGKNADEVPEALIHFLNYIENSTDSYVSQVDDPMITQLHNRVSTLKRSRELEEHYMWMEEWMQQEVNRRVEETVQEEVQKKVEEALQRVQKDKEYNLQQSTQRIFKLISCMAQNGEADMVLHLGEDEAFCKEMLMKYNL